MLRRLGSVGSQTKLRDRRKVEGLRAPGATIRWLEGVTFGGTCAHRQANVHANSTVGCVRVERTTILCVRADRAFFFCMHGTTQCTEASRYPSPLRTGNGARPWVVWRHEHSECMRRLAPRTYGGRFGSATSHANEGRFGDDEYALQTSAQLPHGSDCDELSTKDTLYLYSYVLVVRHPQPHGLLTEPCTTGTELE